MTVFSSVEEAQRFGFQWMEWQPHYGMHLVVNTRTRLDGRRVRSLAWAREARRGHEPEPPRAA